MLSICENAIVPPVNIKFGLFVIPLAAFNNKSPDDGVSATGINVYGLPTIGDGVGVGVSVTVGVGVLVGVSLIVGVGVLVGVTVGVVVLVGVGVGVGVVVGHGPKSTNPGANPVY